MIFVTGTDEAGITGAQDVLGSRPGFKKLTDFFKNHRNLVGSAGSDFKNRRFLN
jgi:hypothetical protein